MSCSTHTRHGLFQRRPIPLQARRYSCPALITCSAQAFFYGGRHPGPALRGPGTSRSPPCIRPAVAPRLGLARMPSTGFVPVLPRHKLRDRKGVEGPEQKDGAPLYISPGFVCRDGTPVLWPGVGYRLRWPDNPHPEGSLRMIGRMVEDGARSIRSIRASFRIRMTTALAISGIESATTRRLLAGVGRRDGACRLDARHRRQPLPGRGGTGPRTSPRGCQPMSSINVSSVTAIR